MKYVLLVLKRFKLKVFEMPVISYTESEFFGAEYISKAEHWKVPLYTTQ